MARFIASKLSLALKITVSHSTAYTSRSSTVIVSPYSSGNSWCKSKWSGTFCFVFITVAPEQPQRLNRYRRQHNSFKFGITFCQIADLF